MSTHLTSFAQTVQSRWKQRTGFRAIQTVQAGEIQMEASIRCTGSRFLQVEYRKLETPWAELESTLSSLLELTSEELLEMSFHHDGYYTWRFDPSTQVVLRKTGRQLFEPIPGTALLGDLAFLERLTHDYLLRDLGEGTRDRRSTRRIGLKPKVSHRVGLLSTTTFPLQKATVEFDTQTMFPVAISWTPAPDAPAAQVLRPGVPVRISYREVELLDNDGSFPRYSPPSDARVFEERSVRLDDLASAAPFSLSLASLERRGITARNGNVRLSLDRDHGRAFVVAHLMLTSNAPENDEPIQLDLCVGNFVSRRMARWRVSLSEKGQDDAAESGLRLYDRRPLWEERLPGVDLSMAPVEAFYQHDDVFWFLSATGLSLDEMESLAVSLREDQRLISPSPASSEEPAPDGH
jgi:hypothetical protein